MQCDIFLIVCANAARRCNPNVSRSVCALYFPAELIYDFIVLGEILDIIGNVEKKDGRNFPLPSYPRSFSSFSLKNYSPKQRRQKQIFPGKHERLRGLLPYSRNRKSPLTWRKFLRCVQLPPPSPLPPRGVPCSVFSADRKQRWRSEAGLPRTRALLFPQRRKREEGARRPGIFQRGRGMGQPRFSCRGRGCTPTGMN
jgi:hypothetical protein